MLLNRKHNLWVMIIFRRGSVIWRLKGRGRYKEKRQGVATLPFLSKGFFTADQSVILDMDFGLNSRSMYPYL